MPQRTSYQPTLESLRQHAVPNWYEDAKFGIFIHWTPSSVPAFAPPKSDIQKLIKDQGSQALFTHSPYSEWYLNSLRIPGSPVNIHHREHYGENYPYAKFVDKFRSEVTRWDPVQWVDLFSEVHARYLVLVTKHHDGFLLWPSATRHPLRPNWHSDRDLVGELTLAARRRDLKVGYYYSGALDWSFTTRPITGFMDMMTSGPATRQYGDYVDKHYRELIDTQQPDILWNDIAFPAKARLKHLIADYYNRIPDGVINDRWFEVTPLFRLIARFPGATGFLNRKASAIFEQGMPGMEQVHADFTTPEYRTLKRISPKKWECVRGIGNSFGFNSAEPQENFLSGAELVRMLVDIVSKNGNLLLNVGPKPDGTIPDVQQESLRGLGGWLGQYGESIFGTRPWIRFDVENTEGVEIRVTQTSESVYLILCSKTTDDQLSLLDFVPPSSNPPVWLATGEPLSSQVTGNKTVVGLPQTGNRTRKESIAEVIKFSK